MQNLWDIFLEVFYCSSYPEYVLSLWLFYHCRCPEYISYLFTFFDFRSDMMSEIVQLWADNSHVYIFSKEDPCMWEIRYFNPVLGPTAYLLYFQTFEIEL